MTTQELINSLFRFTSGLRTPDVRITDADGVEYEITSIGEDDFVTRIEIERMEA